MYIVQPGSATVNTKGVSASPANTRACRCSPTTGRETATGTSIVPAPAAIAAVGVVRPSPSTRTSNAPPVWVTRTSCSGASGGPVNSSVDSAEMTCTPKHYGVAAANDGSVANCLAMAMWPRASSSSASSQVPSSRPVCKSSRPRPPRLIVPGNSAATGPGPPVPRSLSGSPAVRRAFPLGPGPRAHSARRATRPRRRSDSRRRGSGPVRPPTARPLPERRSGRLDDPRVPSPRRGPPRSRRRRCRCRPNATAQEGLSRALDASRRS